MTEKFIPEVGQECEWSLNNKCFEPSIVLYKESLSILIQHSKYEGHRTLLKVDDRDLVFRPLQSAAEKYRGEQVERITQRISCIGLDEQNARELYDEGVRVLREGEFVARKLTERDYDNICQGDASVDRIIYEVERAMYVGGGLRNESTKCWKANNV